MSRLIRRTGERSSLWQKIKAVAFTDVGVLVRGLDEGSLEKLEELLLANDFGVGATMRLVDRVEALSRTGRIQTEKDFLDTVEAEIRAILERDDGGTSELRSVDTKPTVYLMVGVNGVGKTTTIGKLAHRLRRQKKSVLLAAGDTFRAGAIDQLRMWAERVGAEFVGGRPGSDPAAVAFDAVEAGIARGTDYVIVDTAGRLHTQDDLMTELAKVHRVIGRKLEGAPHETLLVLDATVGQNALAQTRIFGKAVPLTGLVLAKLDSTARGGIVVALKEEFALPVKLVGTGESVNALEPFDAATFATEVLAA
jgi:fused signal recognition particle receptor